MKGPIPGEWYDREYFTAGTKSNYRPYGPGDWADGLVRMVMRNLRPESVLDVGCATGWMVKLLSHQTKALGFDISSWAIRNTVAPRAAVWQGDATDPAAWVDVDLVLCTEMLEHLTPEQAQAFMFNAYEHSWRALLLIAVDNGGGAEEGDASHINVAPMGWWIQLAEDADWVVQDASVFNEDPISRKMNWSGRFLLLGK